MLVLYAEDDMDDFHLFCEVIRSLNTRIECVNAPNGVEALHYLETCKVLPDYVIVDINMPAMDGKSCLRHMKADQRFKSIPVIVYSTGRDPLDIALCLQLGAIDYLTKPNTMAEAVQDLSKYFSDVQGEFINIQEY